jgi:hypothetical protein
MKRPVLTALKGVETMPNWMAYNSPAAGLGSDGLPGLFEHMPDAKIYRIYRNLQHFSCNFV